jgi:competence protein ComEC
MIKTAVSFATGCVLFLQLPTLPSNNWFWVALFNIFLFLFAKTRLLAVAIFAALLTFLASSIALDNRLQNTLVGQDITLSGIIASVPEYQDRSIRFDFRPNPASNILPDKIRLSWYRPLPKNLTAGEQWQLTVRLKPPHGTMNPGGFDYERWLFQQGIGATGYVRKNIDNQKLIDSASYNINKLRQSIAENIKTQLPESNNIGLIQGLLTGLRHNISPEQWLILQHSGTSHLLAISGLHIGLAAAIGFFSFRWLWSIRANNLLRLPAKQAGAIGGFSFALFYAALAGFAIPTQRALIMLAVLLLALSSRKQLNSSQILSAAGLLILLIDPVAVLSIGFWLSFSAVGIILFLSQHRYPNPKWQWAKIHTFIALGLTPLLLLFSLKISLIAPLANFIAVPFVSLIIVPLLLLAAVLLWLYPPASVILLKLADTLISLLMQWLSNLASWPYSHWQNTEISSLFFIPILIATIIILSPKGLPAKWLAMLGFLPLLGFTKPGPEHGDFDFILLDVGQGLSAVIQTQHHSLVFDAGAKFNEQSDAGKNIVGPFLRHRGLNKIDTLVISHSDNDHIGGAKHLIKNFDINSVLTSQTTNIDNSQSCLAGQSWQWDGVTFIFLNPHALQIGSKNNLSCVLKVSNASHSVLLTGDIERQTEKKLVKHYGEQLASTILVAPHHGSNTSSTPPFITAVNAQTVLFPAGYLNRYHFPKQQVIQRYQDSGVIRYNTAEHGAILMQLKQQKPQQLITWRQAARKIWTTVATD